MAQSTNIYFKDKLWFSDGFQADKSTRKLSKVINLLLSAHYNIEGDQEEQKTITQLDADLTKLNAEKALILKQKEALEADEEEKKKERIEAGKRKFQEFQAEEMKKGGFRHGSHY